MTYPEGNPSGTSGRAATPFTYVREQHSLTKGNKETPAEAVPSPTGTIPQYLSGAGCWQQLPSAAPDTAKGCTRCRIHPEAAVSNRGCNTYLRNPSRQQNQRQTHLQGGARLSLNRAAG